MKKLLFISHPSSNNLEENRKKVMKICKYWWRKGYIPIAPHLLFSYMGDDRDREIIMKVCYMMIMLCDRFVIYGQSKGCKDELEFAKKLNKRIMYMYEKTNYKKIMESNKEVIL